MRQTKKPSLSASGKIRSAFATPGFIPRAMPANAPGDGEGDLLDGEGKIFQRPLDHLLVLLEIQRAR